VFFCAISAETDSAKRNWSSYHFLMFLQKVVFFITNMRIATEEFLCYVFLLMLNWYWYWSWS